MGIFEKAIPKYTYDPIRQLQVRPVEEVYIDDIFDPVLNKSARQYLGTKYGNPILGTLGGYAELIDNTLVEHNGQWGAFGAGMGLLSTLGRSVDKADDIILGGVTESVNALTGQDVSNPFTEIFTEDKDYTGKKLLASMANSMRNLAGGKTVTEEDFGGLWNVPALGLELLTDPGIAGGKLAKTFAPAAKGMKSVDILRSLASSNAKTNLGNVGQLLSNYDDFVTRAAIDISAPGLRPLGKALIDKLGQIFAVHSSAPLTNIVFNKNVPIEERKLAQQSLQEDPVVQTAIQVADSIDDIMKNIPEEKVTSDLTASTVPTPLTTSTEAPVEIVPDVLDSTPEEVVTKVKESELSRLRKAYKFNLEQSFQTEQLYNTWAEGRRQNLDKLFNDRLVAQNKAVDEMFQIGRALGLTETISPEFSDVDYWKIMQDYSTVSGGDLRDLLEEYRKYLVKNEGTAVLNPYSLKEQFNPSFSFNPEVWSVLDTSEDAFRNMEWTPIGDFDSANNTIRKALDWYAGTQPTKDFYKYAPATVKASEIAVANSPATYAGTEYTMRSLRYILTQSVQKGNLADFTDATSFNKALTSGDIGAAIELLIPDKQTRDRFTQLLTDLSYPPENVDVYRYYKKAKELSNILHSDKFDIASIDDIRSDMQIALENAITSGVLEKSEVESFASRPRPLLQRLIPNWATLPVSQQRKAVTETRRALKRAMAPAETDLVKDLYDMFVENIEPNYIQKMQHMLPHEIDTIDQSLSTAAKVKSPTKSISDKSGEILTYQDLIRDNDKRLTFNKSAKKADRVNNLESMYSYDISRTVNQYIRANADKLSESDIVALTKPIQDFFEVTYTNKLFDNNPTGWTPKILKEYEETVLPVIEENLSKGYNPYLSFSKNKQLRELLGKELQPGDKPHRFANEFNKITESILQWRDDSFSLRKSELLSLADELKKTGKTKGEMSMLLPLRRSATKPVVFIPRRGVGHLIELRTKSPNEIEKFISNRIGYDLYQARALGNHTDYIAEHFYDIFDAWRKKLNSITGDSGKSWTDEQWSEFLKRVFNKDGSFNYKSGKITKSDKRIANYYVQSLEDLSEQSYGLFLRNAADYTTENDFAGIRSVANYIDTVEEDLTDSGRIRKLIESYKKNPNRHFGKSSVDFIRQRVIPRLPINVQYTWKPEKGLFYFDFTNNEIPYEFRLGKDADLRPYRLQLEDRYNSSLYDIARSGLVNPEGRGSYLGWIDYRKLYDSDKRIDLMREVANNRIKMAHVDFEGTAGITKPFAPTQLTPPVKPARTMKLRTTPENALQSTEEVVETLTNLPTEQAAKAAYEAPTVSVELEKQVEQEVAPEIVKMLDSGMSEETVKQMRPRRWELFKKVREAEAIRGNSREATLSTVRAKSLIERATALQKTVKQSDVARVQYLYSRAVGDELVGKDFWHQFRTSGVFNSAYRNNDPLKQSVFETLIHNARIINKELGKEVVEVVQEPLKAGITNVSMRWKVNELEILKLLQKNGKALEKADFQTVLFSAPKQLSNSDLYFLNTDEAKQIQQILKDTQDIVEEQSRVLGFQYENVNPYAKHVMNRSKDTAMYLTTHVYRNTNISDLNELTDAISNMDAYKTVDRGAFGTFSRARRFRGDVTLFNEGDNIQLFYYNLPEIVKSSLADGTFANSKFQEFTNLFVNDNFRISQFASNTDDLRKVLDIDRSKKGYSGNLMNLELVAPKYSANGRVVGLTKFDKFTEYGLQQALKNPDTILIPANSISTIDQVLRKEKRMSDKAWTFINKHFTLPFKFGILLNPGFLLGNVSDAYLKQATTMYSKYNTSLAEELTKGIPNAASKVMKLKNNYMDSFSQWLEYADKHEIKLRPEERIPSIFEAYAPAQKTFFKHAIAFQNSGESFDSLRGILTWIELKKQVSGTKSLQDFDNYVELMGKSKYEMPTNIVDRLAFGKGKYDPKDAKTWGIFVSNPIANKIMGASESIEEFARETSIVNDLLHNGIDPEDWFVLKTRKDAPDIVTHYTQGIDPVDIENAVNTMYNANFDYSRISDTTDTVGKFVPFPTFFLKNLHYWLDLFLKNPRYVSKAIKIQEGLWGGRDVSEDEFLAEAKGRGAIPMPNDAGLPGLFKGLYKPTPLQSMFGAFHMLQNPVEDFMQRTNPLIQGATQIVGKAIPSAKPLTTFGDIYYRPYSTDMYERNITSEDPNFNPLAYTIHRANPFERNLKTYLRTPEKIRAGEAQLSDFLPSVFQPDFSKK